MAFGLGELSLPPNVFWAMTPRELAAAAGPISTIAPPTRATIDKLMQKYPD